MTYQKREIKYVCLTMYVSFEKYEDLKKMETTSTQTHCGTKGLSTPLNFFSFHPHSLRWKGSFERPRKEAKTS